MSGQVPMMAASAMQIGSVEMSRGPSKQSHSEAGGAVAEENRRLHARFPCDGIAEVVVLGGALRFKGRIQNLSSTGCYISTESGFGLERGTQVEIVLEVNRMQFRVGAGVRVLHRGAGVGLEFSQVSSRCARYIKQLIAELAAGPGSH